MGTDDIVALSITMAISLITGLWHGSKKPKKLVVKTFSCHHQEEIEFSGSYRDAARTTKKCAYKIRCHGTGQFALYCPMHHTKLKS